MAIEVLYPEDESNVDVNLDLGLDIIALHGLNGHPLRTWTHPKSSKLWLRDFLPSDFPKARIMTFGYNATAVFDNSTANVEDHARDLLECLVERREIGDAPKRPLIFIGHSLGGLVIKQALIIAETESHYKLIYNSTLGIIFFGTPHKGSSLAAYALNVVKIPNIIANKPNPELLKTLKVGSQVLENLTMDFKRHYNARPYPIASFYELKTMLGMKTLVVEKTSAIMDNFANEEKIPVPANHQDICRFSSPKDQTYKRAVQCIKRIYRGSKVTLPEKNEHYIVPSTVTSHFTGRNEIRQHLQDCLVPDLHYRPRDRQNFVLFGLGGSGKTQLALRFAQDHKNKFWAIFWVDGTTPETVEEGFLNIARKCAQEQNVDSIRAWLSGKDHWLLIIDNADDPTMDISKFFPFGNRGAILITTRNPDVQRFASAGSYKVDELSNDDAISLLLKSSHGGRIDEDTARKSAEKVVKVLGHLAIAIVQAGAVVRQGICSLDGFCELYSQEKKELLEIGKPNAQNDYQYSVYTTWEISIQKIEELTDAHADLALEVLRLISFVHFQGISEDIFKGARVNLYDFREGSIFSKTLLYKLMPSGWDPLVLAKALKILIEFSLITIDESRCIAMHPLVHEWSRDRMGEKDRATAWEMMASTLAMSMFWGFTFTHYQYRRSLLPQIDACLTSKEGRDKLFVAGPHHEERLFMAEKFALAYREGGRYQEAFNLEVQILKWKQILLPSDNPGIPFTMDAVAQCLKYLGRFSESTELRETLLEIARSRSGNDSSEMRKAMEDLAMSWSDLGRYEEALCLYIEVLSASQAAFGAGHPETLFAKRGVASCYSRLKRYKEGVKLQEELLETYQTTLGDTHPTTLVVMEDLSVFYGELKQKKKARKLQNQSLSALELTLGENHPFTLTSKASSVDYYGWSKRKKGIETRIEVVQKLHDTLGDLNLETLNCTTALANSYFACGRLVKAKRLQEKVLQGMIEIMGEEHPETVAAKRYLSQIKMGIAIRKACYWWLPHSIVGC